MFAEVRQGQQPKAARILVLIDDSPEAAGVLEAAMDLARRQQASLQAIFIEELDLVRSAGFPFATEIGATSGRIRSRPDEQLSGELRRRARRVGLALKRMASASGIDCELIVRRGRVVPETLTLALPDDLLIVGRVGWSRRLGRSFGSVPLALARSAPGAVLIWSGVQSRPGGRVVVLAENDADLDSALDIACQRARLYDAGVCVLLPPPVDPAATEAIKSRLAGLRKAHDLAFELRPLRAANTASLLHALGQIGAVELILSRRGNLLTDPAGVRLFERIRLPVCVSP